MNPADAIVEVQFFCDSSLKRKYTFQLNFKQVKQTLGDCLRQDDGSARQVVDLSPFLSEVDIDQSILSQPKDHLDWIKVSVSLSCNRQANVQSELPVVAALAKNNNGNGWFVHGPQHQSVHDDISTWKKNGNLAKAFDDLCGQLHRVPEAINERELVGSELLEQLVEICSANDGEIDEISNEARERATGFYTRAEYLNEIVAALRNADSTGLIHSREWRNIGTDRLEDFLYSIIGVNENEKWQLLAVLGVEPSQYGCSDIDEPIYKARAQKIKPFE